MIGLTKTAALENAKSGIRINAVCPGFIETPMADRIFRVPGVHKYVLSCHPIGRFGRPTEIAEAVVWMCSDRAIFHDGPVPGSRRWLPGGFQFSELDHVGYKPNVTVVFRRRPVGASLRLSTVLDDLGKFVLDYLSGRSHRHRWDDQYLRRAFVWREIPAACSASSVP